MWAARNPKLNKSGLAEPTDSEANSEAKK